MNWVFLKQAGKMEISIDDRYNTVTVATYLSKSADYRAVQAAFKDVTREGARLDRKFEEGELDVYAYDAVLVSEEARVSVTLLLSLGVTKARKEQFFDALEEARIGYKRKYF